MIEFNVIDGRKQATYYPNHLVDEQRDPTVNSIA
jgi:hypothetical protein